MGSNEEIEWPDGRGVSFQGSPDVPVFPRGGLIEWNNRQREEKLIETPVVLLRVRASLRPVSQFRFRDRRHHEVTNFEGIESFPDDLPPRNWSKMDESL